MGGTINPELTKTLYYIFISVACLILVVSIVVTIVYKHKINECHNKLFVKLYDVYDTKEPMKMTFKRIEDVFKYIPKTKVKPKQNDNENIPEL